MNDLIEVSSVEELKKAQKNNYKNIIVNGDLAKNLYKARNVKKLSYVGIGVLTVALSALALTPFTGGASGVIGTGVAGFSAAAGFGLSAGATVSVTAIIVGGISLTALIAIYNDYDMEFEGDIKKTGFKVKLKKTRKS